MIVSCSLCLHLFIRALRPGGSSRSKKIKKNQKKLELSQKRKPQGSLEGPQPLQLQSAEAALPPRGQRFLWRERSAAQTTGTNNRFLAVFAPGNFPQEISAKTVNLLPIRLQLDVSTKLPNRLPQPTAQNESEIHFERIATFSALYPSAARSFSCSGREEHSAVRRPSMYAPSHAAGISAVSKGFISI